MGERPQWWDAIRNQTFDFVEGLVGVGKYESAGRPPGEVAIIEKAREYGADAVFFETAQYGRQATAQAFIYRSDTPGDDDSFAQTHRKLWSWGGVPLVYRSKPGLLQLFRCAHRPDFLMPDGRIECKPFRELQTAEKISADPWWDDQRLRTGTLWSDRAACELLLSSSEGAHKRLFDAFRSLSSYLDEKNVLPKRLRRRLLILSLLIAYLEQREVFSPQFFSSFLPGATQFFHVLSDGGALINLLAALEERFNGNVFSLSESEIEKLLESKQLARFAKMIEARENTTNQLSLWELYSFRDLPIELISQIYQLFVENAESSVYTPSFLVRFLVEEALSWQTLDSITQSQQVILDPSCGSGVFLVESYKRLVLHWRAHNEWKRPDQKVLKALLFYVRGVDLEEDAIELAGFSLCLALCDALQPEDIRKSIKLFPDLRKETLHHGCFFETKEAGQLPARIGVVLGNPPFESKLQTPGAGRSYERYRSEHGKLPDKQVGYLFLHEATEALEPGGTISLLQQYNFLYNQRVREFRNDFFERHWVREVLDFVSVRGLFRKGEADTKVIVVVAQKKVRPENAKVLHATFRRTGRIDAEQGLDLDYYDLHYVPYSVALSNGNVWRANLLGGGRALSLSDRLGDARTLRTYADSRQWEIGEGFIEGGGITRKPARHLTSKPYLPSVALTNEGIDRAQIHSLDAKLFHRSYTESRYIPPMLLVREQMDLNHAVWTEHYLAYSQRIVGICAPLDELPELLAVDKWLTSEKRALRAYIALTSPGLFAQKATALQADDIYSIPYPEEGTFDLSDNERLVVDDIVDYMSEFVRRGESAQAMRSVRPQESAAFSKVFVRQINGVYASHPIKLLGEMSWSGAVCQAYGFGDVSVDWAGDAELQRRISRLLKQQNFEHLQLTSICRVYDGRFVYLLKPDRLRYWLRSTALRDADEVLADLRAQGY